MYSKYTCNIEYTIQIQLFTAQRINGQKAGFAACVNLSLVRTPIALPDPKNQKMMVSWPATTQPTAHRFGVKLVSKGGDLAGFAGYAVF